MQIVMPSHAIVYVHYIFILLILQTTTQRFFTVSNNIKSVMQETNNKTDKRQQTAEIGMRRLLNIHKMSHKTRIIFRFLLLYKCWLTVCILYSHQKKKMVTKAEHRTHVRTHIHFAPLLFERNISFRFFSVLCCCC